MSSPEQPRSQTLCPATEEVTRLVESIRLSRERIVEKCGQLGIPRHDQRCYGAVYAADGAVSVARQWEGATEQPAPLDHLRQRRKELLLHEAAMERNPRSGTPSTRVAEELEDRVHAAQQSVEPLIPHLLARVS